MSTNHAVASNYFAKAQANEFLTFILGSEEYGIEILKVQEIRSYEAVTKIANTPDFIKGVINLRGNIVPIIDLRMRFKLAQAEYSDTTVVIILNLNNRTMGMVVDGVSDVLELKASQISPVPELVSNIDTKYLLGLGTADERMLILVDIEQLIGDSVERVSEGSKLVTEAGITMDEIVASVKKVTDIVNEIAAASQEQSAGIDQVNNAITNMDEVTQQNAALVEEASAAANSLESKAQELTDSTDKFILSDNRLAMKENIKVDLNMVSSSRVNELPSKKSNGYSRLKAPKTKANDNSEWTAF